MIRSIMILFLLATVICLQPLQVVAQDKEIPIIVDKSDDSMAADSNRTVEVVRDQPAEEKAAEPAPVVKPVARPAKGTARVVRGAAPLQPLIRTFRKYRSDADFDPRLTASGDDADQAGAEKLRKELLRWKQMRIEAKGLKTKKDPGFEKLYTEIRDLEEKIIKDYAPQTDVAVVEAGEPGGAEDVANDGVEEIAAKTETGRLLLEKLKARGNEEATDAVADGDETMAVEKASAGQRLDTLRKEREPRGFKPANIRWTPRRITLNQLQPGESGRTMFTIENKGKTTYQGAIVPIEEWIQVNPPTVFLEPRSSIVIDVIATAPDRKKVRLEGSIEIRSPGESSRRVPIVLRTVRR